MREPDHTGPRGGAWTITAENNAHINPRAWLIHAPGQHPAWEWYALGVMDLRRAADIDPDRPAYRQFPDARWEIYVFALDPDREPYDPDDFTMAPLLPQNVQVHIPDHPRELVVATVDAALQACLHGSLILEPPGSVEPLTRHWRSVIEETLRHPHHEGDDRA